MSTKDENVFLPRRSLVQALQKYCDKREGDANIEEKKQISDNHFEKFMQTNKNNPQKAKKRTKFNFFQEKKDNQLCIKSQTKQSHDKNRSVEKNLGPLHHTNRRFSTQNNKRDQAEEYDFYLAFKRQLKLDFENKQSFYRFRINKSKSNRERILKQEKSQQIFPNRNQINKNCFFTVKNAIDPASNNDGIKSLQKIMNRATISDIIKPIPNPRQVFSHRNRFEQNPKQIKVKKFVNKKTMKLEKVDEWRESVRGWTKYPLHLAKQDECFPKSVQNETFFVNVSK